MDRHAPVQGTARLWSLPEANVALQHVRPLLQEARVAIARIRDAEAQLQDLRIVWGEQVLAVACPDHEEFRRYAAEHQAARNELEQVQLRFHALGCEVKDLDLGLVDFRGQVGGREVYLCWKDGEAEIRHWHTLDEGFRGRKPIPGLL